MLDHFLPNAFLLCGLRRIFAGIALIDKRDLHALSILDLHFFGERYHLRTILCVGRRGDERQQMAQRIDGNMYFGALLVLLPIEAGAAAAFRRRLQRASIKGHGRGMRSAFQRQANHLAQIVRGLFEDTRLALASRLLINGRAQRKVMREKPPLTASLNDV